jgi:flagellar hook-associated protein 1 FlgK
MTNLSAALSQALSGLRVSSGQSALVARNVARASEEGYTRKYAGLTTEFDGTARIASVNRNAEKRLADILNASIASADGQSVLLNALQRLQQTVGDVEDDQSLAWGINELQNKLRTFQSNPSNAALANDAVSAASSLVSGLHDASSAVQSLRADADNALGQSVGNINSSLAQLQEINTKITQARPGDETLAELLDQRDRVLKSLSSEIGIRTVTQPNNGIAVYTSGGVTLFNQIARQVTFSPTPGLGPGVFGNAVYADGVAIAGPGAQMPPTQGKIAANAEVRDKIASAYQNQIDEIARGLIVLFSEKDASVTPTLPDATGLFSYAGSPAVPSAAIVIPGLASTIKLNSAFDPAAGGNAFLLRDGGANGIAYRSNTTNAPGFQDRIGALIAAIDAPMTFSGATGLPASSNIKDLSRASAGWVEGLRSEADRKNEYLNTLKARAGEALSRATGVNMDDEMAAMLNLERSYQASAKVITVVDQMFAALLAAVG